MRKITPFLGLLGLLASTTHCTVVTKPVYIDPEADLVEKLNDEYSALMAAPDLETVKQTLNDSYLYTQRMNYKVTQNNKRSLE